MQDDKLDRWFKFLGYGSLHAPVWFVGIEPGGDPQEGGPTEQVEKAKLGQDNVHWDPLPQEEAPKGKAFTLAWRRPVEIVNQLWGRSGSAQENWKWAWRNLMAANVAPLPRRKLGDELLGVDEARYLQRVCSERVPMLLRLLSDLPSLRVMVFHGKAAWSLYGVEAALAQGQGRWTTVSGAPQMRVWEQANKRLVLTNSMTWYRHFTHADRDALAAQLQVWRDRDGDWQMA